MFLTDKVWINPLLSARALTDHGGVGKCRTCIAEVGDAVLRIVARRLEENTRGEDTVSRHGGDEFLYLLMDMENQSVARIIAEKIIQAVQVPCKVSVGELVVTPGIGISIFPKDGTTAESLTQSADTAMYQAKRSKSGYAFANSATISQA